MISHSVTSAGSVNLSVEFEMVCEMEQTSASLVVSRDDVTVSGGTATTSDGSGDDMTVSGRTAMIGDGRLCQDAMGCGWAMPLRECIRGGRHGSLRSPRRPHASSRGR